MLRKFVVLCFLLVCSLACSTPSFAQFKASLQGTVMDAGQAAIAGAKVSITNQATSAERDTETSDQGFYRIAELPPGRYTVTVTATGFKISISSDVEVKAEEPRGFDVTLQVGTVSEQVTVSASAESLHTENANVGTTISTEAIDRLPQVGRDPYELLRFTPGVFGDGSRGGNGGANNLPNSTGPGGSNASIFQVENSVQVVANGQRQDTNNFTIDGVSVNSLQYGGSAVVTPNQQSVQEITVLSNSYSAEDGRTSGAQVKVVSKSGSNQPHGGGFFKYQDPNWNAFNKYGGPNGNPPTRVNNNFRQFGGSIGGPIFKDKLFFFFSYEGLRSNESDVSGGTFVETPQFRQLVTADRPGSIAATILNSAGIEPRIASVLTATCADAGLTEGTDCMAVAGGLDLGSPIGAQGQYVDTSDAAHRIGGGFDGIPDIENVALALPSTSRGDQYNGRFDYIRGKNLFSYSGYFTTVNNLTADSAGRSRPQGDLRIEPFNQVQAFSFIRTFSPTLINEFRVNFTRFNFNQIATSQNVDFGIPRVEIEGYSFDRIRFGPPQGATTPAAFVENSFDVRDTLTKNIRNHSMRLGIDIIGEQNNNNLSGAARPIYSNTTLWNFVNDTPVFEGIDFNPQTGGPADAQRYLRSKDYAFFIQDDWKVKPNFTLNLGLRYEYFSPFSDAKNNLSNIQFPTSGVLADTTLNHVSRLIGRTMRDFGPRLGFAWSPERFHGNTVIRGGGGIAYNRPDDVLFGNAAFNPPNYARTGLCCGTIGDPFDGGKILYELGTNNAFNSYPANPALAFGIDPVTGGVCADTACTSDTGVEIYGGSPNYRDAYVYLYSGEIEHRLPWDLIATVGYQGSVSHKLTRLVNQNFLQAPNPSFTAVYIPTSDINANYNALNLRLRRRFSHGLTFDAQYRYAKSIDQLSNEGPGAQTNQTDPAHPQTEHGPSDFDVKHNVSFFALWDLPFFRDQSRFTGKVLGGWEVNGLMSWHTGFPWTPVTGTIASVPITSAATQSPTRPSGVMNAAGDNNSNNSFITPDANFPGIVHNGDTFPNPADPANPISANCNNADPTTHPGYPYFDICNPGPPGVGRNSRRGPGYFDVDMSVAKKFGLPRLRFLGEGANIELRGNFFNVFNKLNLQPFSFGTDNTKVESVLFGRAPGALAGRVIEFQGKFNF